MAVIRSLWSSPNATSEQSSNATLLVSNPSNDPTHTEAEIGEYAAREIDTEEYAAGSMEAEQYGLDCIDFEAVEEEPGDVDMKHLERRVGHACQGRARDTNYDSEGLGDLRSRR